MAKKSSNLGALKSLARQSQRKIKATVGNLTKKKRSTKKSKAKNNSAKLNKNRGASRRDKRAGKRNTRAKKKAEYLATLPKSPLKRIAYRFHPKRFFDFWFSKRGALMALKLLGIAIAVFAVVTISLFAYFRKDLPDPTSFTFDQSTKFYDRTGKVLLWSVYGDENRTLLEFGQISDNAKHAHIAIEDKDFYNHGGFSIPGITRAAISQIFGDGSGGGGSTITQQFVKNSLVGNEFSITRKIKELILSVEIERLYTKDEILTFYLNEIPYGVSEYGIESAAQGFFNKPASELTVDESAMLAALPQAPSLYSPYSGNTELLIGRRDYIIDLMRDQGYVSDEEAQAAKDTDTLAKIVPLSQRSKYKNIKAPHFVLEVQKQLTEKYGDAIVTKGGLNVITTLDMDLQKIAEEAVENNIYRLDQVGANNTAFAAGDPTNGQVLAMVGSRDFEYEGFGSYNVTTSLRQPGSSFKPYVYSELFKSDRWGPGSVIFDTPTSFGNYRPKDADGRFRGTMTIRSALAQSRNIPAVKALYIAGIGNAIDQAERQGITSLAGPDQYGLSLTLGSAEVKLVEHMNGYSTFANGGKHYPQTYILKVTNSSGEVLEEWTEQEGEDALDPQIAYAITSILSDTAARAQLFGTGSPYANVPGLNLAVKTGTTDLERDGWMMAYTTDLVAGTWVGNNDNRPMYGQSYTMTGSVMMEFMRRAHEELDYEAREFVRPDGIKTVRIDSRTGRATDSGGHTDIFPSWYKPIGKDDAKDITIDKISGKLATECTPERAKEKTKESGVLPEIPEDDPMFPLWAKSAPYGPSADSEDKDDVHKCSDSLPNVSVSYSVINGDIVELSATVSEGTHPLDTLNFKIDGQTVSAVDLSGGGSYNYTHKFGSTGDFTFTAEVIDEVLYDNSSNPENINISSTVNPPEITSTNNIGNNTLVTWNKVSGATHAVCWKPSGGTYTCVNDNNGTHMINGTSGDDWLVYITADVSGYELRSEEKSFSN